MCCVVMVVYIFFFKQKTAYEMRISDWSSDVCSSDLKLKQLSGLTGRGNTVDIELPKIFGNKAVLDILLDLETQVTETEEHPYSSFIYNKILDRKSVV